MPRHKKNLIDSCRIFKDVVWPALTTHCPAFAQCQLIPAENEPFELARKIDMWGGFDCFVFDPSGGLTGVASRIQWGPSAVRRDGQPWDSFTVRTRRSSGAATEYEKRRDAITRGTMYPDWHIQAYMSDNSQQPKLLSVAAVKTKELYDWMFSWLAMGRSLCEREAVDTDGSRAWFWPIWWRWIDGCESFWSHHEKPNVPDTP